jgi:hypothetical protein
MAEIVDSLRYAGRVRCSTPLDPIADCTAWIAGLRSTEYTASMLRGAHGFSNRADILEASKVIRAHAQAVLEFLDQAQRGPTRASFLPLYYAMLNLAKIAIVFRGGLRDLERQRHHGAFWSGLTSRGQDLLSDHITVRSKGAIALFYRALAGHHHAALDGRIYLRQVYPLISSVGFEYRQAYQAEPLLLPVRVYMEQEDGKGWRVEATASLDHHIPLDPKSLFLKGFRKTTHGKASRWVAATDAKTAHAALAVHVNWWMLYHTVIGGMVTTSMPSRKCRRVLPQELPVLLAMFHLGNVVRYDPERLARLYDSRAVTVLEILRRHGLLTYLTAIWSFYAQKQHVISPA